jgi:GNAT superfamily N-acetyltransferase
MHLPVAYAATIDHRSEGLFITMFRIELLADHPEWVPLIAQWHWKEWGHLDPEGSLKKWTDALADRTKKDGIPMTIVAVEDEKPVGSVTLEEHDMETRKDLTPWLSGVFVKPIYRFRGIASLLIQSAMDKAQRLGVETLYLYTRSASGLYHKLGWIEMENCHYQGREVIIMVCQLGT